MLILHGVSCKMKDLSQMTFLLYFLLNCLKCLIQILNDIIDIFCTDRKTDRVWLDSLIKSSASLHSECVVLAG